MPRLPLNRLLAAVVLLAVPVVASSQDAGEVTGQPVAAEALAPIEILPAEEVDLDAFLWANRVLVVFSDTPADPRFIQQMQLIEQRPRDLLERDVVVVSDTDPAARSDVRKKLRPRGFALVLIDKDGVVKLRKPSPWATREIARSIDKTPLRREEIRERLGGTGTQ